MMHISKITFFRLLVLAVLASVLAQAIHETGHMIVYQIYRRDPTWGFIGLVQVWDKEPPDPNNWVRIHAPDGSIGWLRLASSPESKTEELLAALGGPLASLVSAALGVWMAYKHRNAGSLMLALTTSFTMIAYYLRSPLRSLGDEFDIAFQLGLPKPLVEVTFGFAFLFCFIGGLRPLDTGRIRLNWVFPTILGSITTGILLNIADQWVRELVQQNNLLSQSVLGYALPVLLIYLLTIMSILIWASTTRKVIPI